MRLVPTSMSCTVCLCRKSQLSFLPLQSLLTFGVNIFPSNDSHNYVDLPDKVRSALCGVGRVNSHVCGGYCTCVWRAVYMCVFAYMCTSPTPLIGGHNLS